MAAAMDHVVDGPAGTETATESCEDLARVTVATDVEPGQRLRLVKFAGLRLVEPAVACRRCATRSPRRWPRRGTPAGTACCWPARATSTTSGTRADVELDGDPELQQAVRFALFHVLQAAPGPSGARSPPRA